MKMASEIINGDLKIEVPEGYRVLSKEEMKAMYLDDNPDRWAMRNEAMHHTVAVLYHKSNPFLAMLADVKSIAESTQLKLSRGLAPYQYERGEFFPASLCGQKAYGFTYRYVNHEVLTDGKVIVFKHGNICYTVYEYSADGYTDANRPVFESVCSSMEL